MQRNQVPTQPSPQEVEEAIKEFTFLVRCAVIAMILGIIGLLVCIFVKDEGFFWMSFTSATLGAALRFRLWWRTERKLR